jgi:hypothetical protein
LAWCCFVLFDLHFFGLDWIGLVWVAFVCLSVVWFGLGCLGLVWSGLVGFVRFLFCLVWFGVVDWFDVVGNGMQQPAHNDWQFVCHHVFVSNIYCIIIDGIKK